MIKDQKPNVSFSFGGIKPNLKSLSLRINGRDVTESSVLTPLFISYKPQDPFSGGKYMVEVSFFTVEGKKVDFSWSFTVEEGDIITSVTHDGVPPLMAGEEMTVEIEGKPGCHASFDIGSFKKDIPMKEISPGIYRGIYKAGNMDYAADEPVVGVLRGPQGVFCRESAKTKISIFAQLFRLKILSPKNCDHVGKSFVIRGRTKPGAMVFFATRLGYKNTDFISATGPDTGGLTAVADAAGFFEKTLGFPLFMRGMECNITIYARDKDKDKSKSNTEELVVYFRNEEKTSP